MQFCCCRQDPKDLNNQCMLRPRQPCRAHRLRRVSLAFRSQRPWGAPRRRVGSPAARAPPPPAVPDCPVRRTRCGRVANTARYRVK